MKTLGAACFSIQACQADADFDFRSNEAAASAGFFLRVLWVNW